jgi:uncharacterized membrane protein
VSVARRITGEDIRASLGLWPVVGAAVSFVLTLLLLEVRVPDGVWARLAWPGDVASATALLQVVASSVIAATTLIFSLTVVALQLASQQFSPRLLREFARDRFTQFVLTVLVCTFVVALTGLRGMRADAPIPRLVVALSLVLGIVSVGLLLVFLGHVVRSLRIDGLMLAVHRDTEETIADVDDRMEEGSRPPAASLLARDGGTLVCSPRSGFVQAIYPRELVDVARRHGAFLRIDLHPGDHVVEGTPMATLWAEPGAVVDPERLADDISGCIDTGFERTVEQDAAFGLRQLTDIAVKAISPAVNDPVTCAHALGYCADLLLRLQRSHLGPTVLSDDEGVPRVVVPARDHRYYLDLVCSPVRRYGNHEPIVLSALMRLLRDCAVGAQDDSQRLEIRRQVSFVLEEGRDGLREQDFDAVLDLARRVELALTGQTGAAYRDRAGETRSV